MLESASGGVSGPGGVWSGGVLFAPGKGGLVPGGVSQHALRQTPPVNRITNTCKNITLATTSLRPVINYISCVFVRGETGVP